jgi:Negative regulator of beta-lactamase expression
MMAALGSVRFLTIHCAATPEGRAVSADTISKWDIDKFGQVSYHWVIELDGAMKRTLPDSVRGAHVGKANTGNIGICYVGGVDAKGAPKDTRTPAQKRALRTLIRTYRERYPGIVIRGHRDWPNVAKACPSFDVASWIAAGMPA